MRVHSLTTRFVLTLLLSTALPFLAFGWYARVEMESRLESRVVQVFLPDLAAAAASEIDAGLRRTRQGCAGVVNLVRDTLRGGKPGLDFSQQVDFTLEIDPDLVLLVDGDGEVQGQRLHPRFDPKTRAAREELVPESVASSAWFQRVASGVGEVWTDRHLSEFRHKTPQRESLDPADYSFGLAFSVPTEQARSYGAVYWLMPWTEVQQVLDRTANFLRAEAGLPSAEVFLCNERGEYLAHTDRSFYARSGVPDVLVSALPEPGAAVERAFSTPDEEERRAGLAAVASTPSLRWWVGLHASSDELLATSRELGDVLLVVTSVTALILVGWSMVASRAILRPVRRLAVATEAVARGDLSVRVPARGRHELADLGRAFNDMAGDLEQSREQLRHAERQAAWAEMARQVAHEIKNPLTPMRMSAQLLLKAKRDRADRVEELTERLAHTVLEQTEALSRIASDFRQFAGPPDRRLEVVAADRLVEEVRDFFSAMAEVGGAELVFRADSEGAHIQVDRDELRRVFINLIDNAVAACGDSGRVEVSSANSGDRVVFRVRDDGPGVDAEVRASLFDPYFTTKSSGTGLGLAICRRILDAHGGAIVLEDSRPGATVFRFEIPKCEGTPEE